MEYDDADGTFMVAPWGSVDDWALLVGSVEWLLEERPKFVIIVGESLTLVDRDTGALTFATFLMEPERIDAANPVGVTDPRT